MEPSDQRANSNSDETIDVIGPQAPSDQLSNDGSPGIDALGWSLRKGYKLGPYTVISPLGAGGMGEVYRARDTRLDRDVAIKILPQSSASSADLTRFAKEARAIAALNHPRILAVYDVGAQNGVHYIVTELLDGRTLREALKNGKFSVRSAIGCATQVAQGLAAAHEKGFLHRDLKPENILIGRDGLVKILDFGLAKQFRRTDAHGDSTTSDTRGGAILGTIGYMAPEQIRGEELDHRTDIFAFGAVVFEMLTGQRAFHGTSWLDTAGAILHKDPQEFNEMTVEGFLPALRNMIFRCLEKDRENRFQSAKDLSYTLECISQSSTRTELQELPKVSGRHLARTLIVGGLCAFGAALGALGFLWGRTRGVQQPLYSQVTFRKGPVAAARFSQDGRSVIYSAAWENSNSQLYRSNPDGTDAHTFDLPASTLFSVSRSGELAISTSDRLAQVSMTGGTPRELLDNVGYADWSPDGSELAVTVYANGRWRIEYPIGHILYETAGYITNVRVSPHGDLVAFMNHPVLGDDRGTVALVDTKGNQRNLTHEFGGEMGLAWAPNGQEVWFTATSTNDWDRPLYAVNLSGRLRIVLRIPGAMYIEDIAMDGRVLFRREERRWEVNAASNNSSPRMISWSEVMESGPISHDGRFAAVSDMGSAGQNYNLYLAKLDGSPPVHLGSGLPGGISPDNKYVASVLPSDTSKLRIIPTGVGVVNTISTPGFEYRLAFWTLDGKYLIVLGSQSGRPFRYWLESLDGHQLTPIGPEEKQGVIVALNHKEYLAATDPSNSTLLYPLLDAKPIHVAGLRLADEIVGGSISSDDIYVLAGPAKPLSEHIEKVNVRTGHRESVVTLSAIDAPGTIGMGSPSISDDGRNYLFPQIRELSVLYVATGLK